MSFKTKGERHVKYKPLYDRVLIKLDNPDKYSISKGGIIMPEEARDMTGIVLEVGMGRVDRKSVV